MNNTTTKTPLTPEQREAKVNELINGLAEDLKETVQKIEASIATTQHHYGRYGALISGLAKGNKNVAAIIAKACIKAGGNPAGVANGLKLFC